MCISAGTRRTYSYHIAQVRRLCGLLNAHSLPASLATIRQVSSAVNNASTFRGWLSAWRQLHLLARLPWAGDGDMFLRAVRLGLAKSCRSPPTRRWMRKSRLLQLLKSCIQNQLYLEAAAAALAYTFGLRIPSELLGQADCKLFRVSRQTISYGQIKRKGQLQLRTLRRP